MKGCSFLGRKRTPRFYYLIDGQPMRLEILGDALGGVLSFAGRVLCGAHKRKHTEGSEEDRTHGKECLCVLGHTRKVNYDTSIP